MKRLASFIIGIAAVTAAFADFTGPAPLAWRWSQPATASPSGAPIVDSDAVYVASGGRIYSLGRESGAEIWRFPKGEPIQANFRLGAIKTGNAIVAASDARIIYAVDHVTGAQLWTYPTPISVVGRGIFFNNDRLAFPVEGNRILVLDANTGQPVGEPVSVGEPIIGGLAAYQNNLIFMTDRGRLSSLNLSTGRMNWQASLTSFTRTAVPRVIGDQILVPSGTFLTSVRAGTGTLAWQTNIGETLVFEPAVSDNNIAVVTTNSNVFNLDNRGRFVSRRGFKLPAPPVTSPSWVGRYVAQPTADGRVNVLDPAVGEMIFSYAVPAPLGPRRDATEGAGRSGPGAGSGGGGNAADEGGGGGGARGGGAGGGTASTTPTVSYIPAVGPAVLSGTTMFVLAADGSLLAFDRTLGVDLTAPDISMTWPNPGEQIWGVPPLVFLFQVSDFGSGIKEDTIKVTIDGQTYTSRFERTGRLIVEVTNSAPNRPLLDGPRVIEVTATDWMGNVAKKQFRVTVDNSLRPPARQTGTAAGGPGAGSGGGGNRGGGGGGGRSGG